jgi:hypothetical protein
VNENGLRHFGQKPSVRPGRPSRARPTGAPQEGQDRLFSGTSGFRMITFDASTVGAGGTRVRPAPSRAARSRVDPEWVRRVVVEPLRRARCEPSAVELSRLELRVIVDATPAVPAGSDPAPLPVRSGGLTGGVVGTQAESPSAPAAPADPGDPQTSQ